jgi:hypothetical protein
VGSKNFIEINGKRYDAITGRMLVSQASHEVKPAASIQPHHSGGLVDGVTRRPQQKKVVQRSIALPAGKQPQKSQTLMRRTVKKPDIATRKTAPKEPTIQKSQLGTSARRSQTAMQTPRSQHVKKFGEYAHRSSIVKITNPSMTVKSEPVHPAVPHRNTSNLPLRHVEQRAPQTATERMITSALANANSHAEVAPTHRIIRKRNRVIRKLGISARAASMSTAVLAAVLLVGFFAVQNVPNLSMRVAATRAGFNATMPGYQPSGFSFKGPINFSPGQVIISFKSNTDGRAYEVKQQASKWNSEALLVNYVQKSDRQYQTYLDRGRTLYIYDGSNATWVNDGVWYTIEGESSMTTDQLIRIAASI